MGCSMARHEQATSVAMSALACHLGDLRHRVDALERSHELEVAVALAAGSVVPGAGERIVAVGHRWTSGEQRRVLCSGATGPHAALLQISAVTFDAYARRQHWDLVLSNEPSPANRSAHWIKLPLVRDLLQDYDVVAWLDADAMIVDFGHDLGDELEPGKDFYLVQQEGGVPLERVLNSGVLMLRAGGWTERLLDEIWSQADAHPRWFDNAAVMRVLGYDVDEFPLRGGKYVPWLEHVKLIDLAWNSVPHWSRSPHPRINHWCGLPIARRRSLMLDDLARAMVRKSPSEPTADVHSRADLPAMFNRLGLIGVGAVVGKLDADDAAWILHRWCGSKLISIDPAANDGDPIDPGPDEDYLAEVAIRRLAPFGARSEIWRMAPCDAVEHLSDHSLDFVCVADHGRQKLPDEIRRWRSKVRPGGVIFGSARSNPTVDGRSITRAFDGLRVRWTAEVQQASDAPTASWWVIMPRAVPRVPAS